MEEIKIQENLLSFDKEKVQELTLEQLKRTYRENDVYGKPLKGMYHHQVIDRCNEVAMDAGLKLVITEIFAAQNRDKMQPGVVLLPQIEEQYGERAIEAHILRRVFVNMRLEDYDTDEFTSNLAIAFHQEGIQIAFGNMVRVCHNQTILGRDRMVSSYGKDKVESFEKMFNIIGEWMRDSRHIIETDRETIWQMKNAILEPQHVLQIIGELTTLRVIHDTTNSAIRKPDIYPLNQTQISRFTEELLLKKHNQDVLTVWDIYNTATELFKANRMEIPNMLPQNIAMAEYLIKNWL